MLGAPSPLSAAGPSGSPRCRSRCPAPRGPPLRGQVPLQCFQPGSEAIFVAAKGITPRLGGPAVFIHLIKGGLQVALRGLRADLVAAAVPPPIHPQPPSPGHVPPAPRGCLYAGPWGGGGTAVSPWGAGGFPLRGGGDGGGGGVLPPLDVNDVNPTSHPPRVDAHGKSCHGQPLRPPLLPTRDHGQPNDASFGHRPLLHNPRHSRPHRPLPAYKPVGKHAQKILVGTPLHRKGAGEGDAAIGLHPLGLHGQVPHGSTMPLPPVGPERHPLLPGKIWLPGGHGDPGQAGFEVGGAQVLVGQHVIDGTWG